MKLPEVNANEDGSCSGKLSETLGRLIYIIRNASHSDQRLHYIADSLISILYTMDESRDTIKTRNLDVLGMTGTENARKLLTFCQKNWLYKFL